jgi:hypothetical protein
VTTMWDFGQLGKKTCVQFPMDFGGSWGSHDGYPHRIPERERRAGITAVCIFSKEENQSHWSFANVLREERRESIADLP